MNFAPFLTTHELRDCPQAEPQPEFYDEPAEYWRAVELWRVVCEPQSTGSKV